MGVHGLALILVLGAEAHVGHLSPLAGEGFAITVLPGVEAMCLDALEETNRINQGFFITGGTMVFAQSVDGKAEGINLLLRIEGLPFAVERPVDATEFVVVETVDEVTLGTRGGSEVFFLLQEAIGR